jgi:hypothetical protein
VANVKNGNTLYVDSTGTLTTVPTRVTHILVSSTSNNAAFVLQDQGASVNKIDIRVTPAHITQVIDLSDNPMFFPTGIKVSNITHAVATMIYSVQGG